MLPTARRAIVFPACTLAALTATSGVAAPPSMTDQLLASQCAQCHGTYGRPVRDIEGLAGKSYGSLYSDMMEMRTEGTPSEIMEHQAFGYTEEQIQRIARYYSALSESGTTSSGYSSTTSTATATGSPTTTTEAASGGSTRLRSETRRRSTRPDGD